MAIWNVTTGSVSDRLYQDGQILSGDALSSHLHFMPIVSIFGTNSASSAAGSIFVGSFAVANPPGSVVMQVFGYNTSLTNQTQDIRMDYKADAASSGTWVQFFSESNGNDNQSAYTGMTFANLPVGSFVIQMTGSQTSSNSITIGVRGGIVTQYQRF